LTAFIIPLDKYITMCYYLVNGGKDMKLMRYKCLRCNHEWIPRKDETPVVCSKCKSPYWNKAKQIKEENK